MKQRGGKKQASASARRSKRHSTDTLSCALGEIADISKSGMRIRCSGRPPVKVGQALQVKLEASGQILPVAAVVVWIRRSGFRAFQIGLQFAKINPAVSAAIESIAMYGFVDLDAARRRGAAASRTAGKVAATIDLPNYYLLLEVDPEASADDIQDAFRTLARQYHPDVNSDPDSVQHFIRVTEAYEVLRDSRSRKCYDQRRAA